tara:strand:- start:4875 stop:6767 length:1893 start_codon:yes stop_codon:yes gene_type:complete
MNVGEVKQALADSAESVCMHLFPNGKKKGKEWLVGSIDGEAGRTLQICVGGAKVGKWKDFNGSEGGNNLLELWIRKEGIDFLTALNKAKDFLGIKDDSPFKEVKKEYFIPETPKDVIGDKAMHHLISRGLSEETIKKYDVCGNPSDTEIVFPYKSPEGDMEMIKYIKLERSERGKKGVRTSPDSKKGLFGKHTIGGNDSIVIITEGEIDAMSYSECGYAALSIPFGAKWESESGDDPNQEWIENDWEFLERFDEIFLSMDMDEAGQRALTSVVKRLGMERCGIIKLTEKDANDVLVKHGTEALAKAVTDVAYIDPEKLKNVAEFFDVMQDKFFGDAEITVGIPTPWNIPFHFRMNELTVLTGFNGSGKSMLLNWMCVNLCNMGKRTCIASLEVRPDETLKALVRQAIAADTPDGDDHLKESLDWLGQGFWFYDHHGAIDADEMLKSFIYAHRRYNVQFFIVDSLMKLGLRFDDYNAQKRLMDKITDFVDKYDVHVFLVAHSRKKDSEGERAGKMDVKGISEITDNAHNVISIWRNKEKEELMYTLRQSPNPEDRVREMDVKSKVHDAVFSVEKQRGDKGEEPKLKLFYNIDTRQYHAEHGEREIFIEPQTGLDADPSLEDETTEEDDEPF